MLEAGQFSILWSGGNRQNHRTPAQGLCAAVGSRGLLQKTNLRQALIYIHFRPEDRILDQTVENFLHFGHAYADSTVLVGPES